MITVLAVALLMTQTPGGAPPKTGANAAERVVCRNEPQAGTRIPVRACMSQQAWNDRREATEQYRTHNRPVIDGRSPGRGIGRW